MDEIQSIDWALLFSCNSDPSCMFDTFYSKISEFIDLHIPLKQLSKKESKLKTKPWITSAIRTSIKIKKNKLYKKFLKTKSSYYQTKFKVNRNKLNNLIKISNDYFSIHLNDGKRIWKRIKQLNYPNNLTGKIGHKQSCFERHRNNRSYINCKCF